MRKIIIHLLSLSLLAAAATIAPGPAAAAEKTKAADSSPKAKPAARSPFQGRLKALDKTAMTLTIEGKGKSRTLNITSETRFSKAGKPATLEDAAVGDEVAGQVIRKADGKEEAVSVRIGPKSEVKEKKKKEPAAKKD